MTVLQEDKGCEIQDHQGKASLLWEAYKERLGSSEFLVMHFNLLDLISPHEYLAWLEAPFEQ